MSTTINKESVETLNDLIEVLKDGQQGFQTAAKDAKAPELSQVFNKYAAQRTQFASELQSHVAQLGGDIEKSGTVSGKVHRGWINLKAALSSNEPHAVLSEAERGEDAAVAAYKKALERTDIDSSTRDLISRQSVEVKSAHDHVRNLRDSGKYGKAK